MPASNYRWNCENISCVRQPFNCFVQILGLSVRLGLSHGCFLYTIARQYGIHKTSPHIAGVNPGPFAMKSIRRHTKRTMMDISIKERNYSTSHTCHTEIDTTMRALHKISDCAISNIRSYMDSSFLWNSTLSTKVNVCRERISGTPLLCANRISAVFMAQQWKANGSQHNWFCMYILQLCKQI